ncbi:unnamed protein product [Caenorhabditis nigoni]
MLHYEILSMKDEGGHCRDDQRTKGPGAEFYFFNGAEEKYNVTTDGIKGNDQPKKGGSKCRIGEDQEKQKEEEQIRSPVYK